MKTNLIFAIVCIVSLFALLTLIMTLGANGQPASNIVQPALNANSCSADDTCEVTKILFNSFSVSIPANRIPKILSMGILKLEVKEAYMQSKLEINATNVVVISSNLTAKSLAGSGSAYVCVDRNGLLFRKLTPCR